jgi:hypothetical protein
VNRRLPRERRLQVHAIVDSDVAPDIRTRLRLWQCEILDIFRRDKPVLNPEEVKGLVAARLQRSRRQLDEAAYWDVTDGRDGVGLLMYRYLAGRRHRRAPAGRLDQPTRSLRLVGRSRDRPRRPDSLRPPSGGILGHRLVPRP